MKIGFFDSGLGGLVVLKAVAATLPQYSYEYYGDTAHLPYGDKTEEEIYELTKLGVEHLFLHDCALVIIACNTASAETLRRLQDEFLPAKYPGRRILGVIIPVIEEVITSGCKRVLMIATRRTVSSGKYHLELGKRNELKVKIEAVATPELVPLIEAGKLDEAMTQISTLIEERLQRGVALDGLILGCTHYTLLTDRLRDRYGATLTIFTQTEIIPRKLADYLQTHPEIEGTLDRSGERNIYLTEHRPDYDVHLAMFLQGTYIADA